jgi:hypothetical protein
VYNSLKHEDTFSQGLVLHNLIMAYQVLHAPNSYY